MRHHRVICSVVRRCARHLIRLHRATGADQRFCCRCRWLSSDRSALAAVIDSHRLQDLLQPLSFRLFMRLTSSIAECTSSLA